MNWLLPASDNFSAIPNALTDMTETEPTVEQIEMYISGFRLPYFGAYLYIMTVEKATAAVQYSRKPIQMSVDSDVDAWGFLPGCMA